MAYCVVNDVQERIKSVTFSTTTKPTLAGVTDFITINSDIIDGRIAEKYEIPITGTKALNIVKKICVYMTLADIFDILPQGLGLNSDDKEERINYRKVAEDLLCAVEEGTVSLPDAPTSGASSSFYNSNVACGRTSVIKKDRIQW